jgi:hypothetical protein
MPTRFWGGCGRNPQGPQIGAAKTPARRENPIPMEGVWTLRLSMGTFPWERRSETPSRNFSQTAVCGTACTVVWEDGGGNPASYPIPALTIGAGGNF